MTLTLPRLVLASASPRRRELLAGLGLDFTVRPVDLDETPRPGEAPHDYVLRLAAEKAAAGSACPEQATGSAGGAHTKEPRRDKRSQQPAARAGELVLAADTIVVLGDELLGKPRDPGDARRMLGKIAGRTHTVLTGVAFEERRNGKGPRRAVQVESSRVRMAVLSEAEIAWYVATGEPLDKAGSYAVQGLGALFVEAIEGNYSNVVGLPLPLTARLCRELGYDLLGFRPPAAGTSA